MKSENTAYVFTALNFTYLLYDLQVNIDITQIFTDDIFTILPLLINSYIMLLCECQSLAL